MPDKTPIELSPIGEICIPQKSGKVNLADILGFQPDVVDRIFEQFLRAVGETYSNEELVYLAHRIDKIETANDLPRLEQSEASNTCSVLSALKDSGLLVIPKGKTEREVVLGVATFDDVEFVLLVEHEFKNGSDQIHCHARAPWNWGSESNKDLILLTRKTN